MQNARWSLIVLWLLAAVIFVLFLMWRAFFRWRRSDISVQLELAKVGAVLGALITIVITPSIFRLSHYDTKPHTDDESRFATRNQQVIQLHPSNIIFKIPQDWLEWDSQFHNNLHLTHQELQKVRNGAGEWDWEYGRVVNASLPFEHCAAHVGGEGWGLEGVSFGDLQVRGYVTDLPHQRILESIQGPGFKEAESIAKSEGGVTGNDADISISKAGDWRNGAWQRVTIRYPLWYGDYGGEAVIDFYVKDAYPYRLVLVFMGRGEEGERSSILSSVSTAMK